MPELEGTSCFWCGFTECNGYEHEVLEVMDIGTWFQCYLCDRQFFEPLVGYSSTGQIVEKST